MIHPAVLLATIEHSGTNHGISILGRSVRFPGQPWHGDLGIVIVAHTDDEHMPLIRELAGAMPLITTQRPVSDIRASWARRNRLPAEASRLTRQIRNYEELREMYDPNVIVLGART